MLTPLTPDLTDRFADGITQESLFDPREEWGLYAFTQIMQNTGSGLCNQGFLREEAGLHLVVISDEPDQSWGENFDEQWWLPYVEELLAYKQDPSMMKISAIVGDAPDGCDGADSGASAGDGYIEAAEYTGGEFLSICGDWPNQLEVLADASGEQTLFPLSQQPKPDTIVVFKNTTEVSNWTYAAEPNAVVFTSDPPSGGDEVRVTYEPM